MRILFLCNKMPYPPNDGGAIATLSMIKGFANSNDSVKVLAMQTHKHSFPITKLPNQLLKNIEWNQVWVDTKLRPIKALINILFSVKPYNAIRFKSYNFKNKLISLLQQNEYDIIQLEGIYLYSYINIIRQFSGAKVVLRAHNVENEIWHRLAYNENNVFKKRYLIQLYKRVRNLEFKLLKKIDMLVPITRKDAEILQIYNSSKVLVSPTGIDDSAFKRQSPKYAETIFYIGALDWTPNQEALLWFLNNVWGEIKIEFPQWEFVIAGRSAPKVFEDKLNNFNVKYVGEVESAIDFIDSHNVMVVPLMSGSGMRIKIIEGMARGKCILTTKIGAEGIYAKNGESIYIQDSANEFKQVLRKVMNNQSIIETCGEKAFAFVQENYNNQVIINRLRKFYLSNIS